MDIGGRIRKALKTRGMSQAKFAKKIGLDPAQMNSYVCNKTEPGSYILLRIARGLEVSSDYLLGLREDME